MDYSQMMRDRLAESLDPQMQERYKKRRADAVAAQSANFQGPEAIDALADGKRMSALQSGLNSAANKFGSIGGDGGQKSNLAATLGAMDDASEDAFKMHQGAYDAGVKAEDAALDGMNEASDRSVGLAGKLDTAERTGITRGREDAEYTRSQGIQADEDALDSDVSRSYQALAKKYSPSTDFSKMPASRIKQLIPSIERAYTIDEQSKAKIEHARQWTETQRENRNDRARARSDAERARRDAQDRDYAFKREQVDAKAAEAKANPKPLGSEQQKRKDDAQAAADAVDGMEKALVTDNQNTFSIVGDNDYTMNEKRFVEFFGRLQSGGAIGVEEAKAFKKLLPGVGDSKEMQKNKLADMKSRLAAILQPFGGGAGVLQATPASSGASASGGSVHGSDLP